MITLTNDWHNTSTQIRANVGDRLNETQVRRIERRLCPYSDCVCQPIRGKQDYDLDPVGREYDGNIERTIYRVVSRWENSNG